jgi:hypothetical protein
VWRGNINPLVYIHGVVTGEIKLHVCQIKVFANISLCQQKLNLAAQKNAKEQELFKHGLSF